MPCACRDATIPASLAHRSELFTKLGWLQVMLGQGIESAACNPLADARPPHELPRFLAHHRAHAQGVAAAMPTHEQFLAQHRAAPTGSAA